MCRTRRMRSVCTDHVVGARAVSSYDLGESEVTRTFDCVGVGAPHPCVVQGSTACHRRGTVMLKELLQTGRKRPGTKVKKWTEDRTRYLENTNSSKRARSCITLLTRRDAGETPGDTSCPLAGRPAGEQTLRPCTGPRAEEAFSRVVLGREARPAPTSILKRTYSLTLQLRSSRVPCGHTYTCAQTPTDKTAPSGGAKDLNNRMPLKVQTHLCHKKRDTDLGLCSSAWVMRRDLWCLSLRGPLGAQLSPASLGLGGGLARTPGCLEGSREVTQTSVAGRSGSRVPSCVLFHFGVGMT